MYHFLFFFSVLSFLVLVGSFIGEIWRFEKEKNVTLNIALEKHQAVVKICRRMNNAGNKNNYILYYQHSHYILHASYHSIIQFFYYLFF